jgi:hypothetical protein
MPLFLLLLGVVTTVSGLVLVGSGLAPREGTFDTEILTPGTIAAVGGLLLIGLGLAVRALQRIERALAARPMPRAARSGEAAVAAAIGAPASELSHPLSSGPDIGPLLPEPAGTPVAAAPAEDTALEELRAKFPTFARLQAGSASTADASLAPEVPQPPLRADEGIAEVKSAATLGHGRNGPGPVRAVPRLDAKSRAAVPSARTRGTVLQSFWPVVPRPNGQKPPAQAGAQSPVPVVEPVPVAESPPVSGPASEPGAPVSVLKSGVVEGMAYTLYSDGSIEAQLPQGTLRFGSISALREHIESTS